MLPVGLMHSSFARTPSTVRRGVATIGDGEADARGEGLINPMEVGNQASVRRFSQSRPIDLNRVHSLWWLLCASSRFPSDPSQARDDKAAAKSTLESHRPFALRISGFFLISGRPVVISQDAPYSNPSAANRCELYGEPCVAQFQLRLAAGDSPPSCMEFGEAFCP